MTDRRPEGAADDPVPSDDAPEERDGSGASAADGDTGLEARDDSAASAADGDTGLEARDDSGASAAEGETAGSGDGAASELGGGLRSASSIFGEAKLPDNWPTRREIRAAERAARESGEVEPVTATDETVTSGPADDDDITRALSMPEELAARSGPEVPAASEVPPASAAPHPMSIELPFAASTREDRAEETRAIDEERRRLDPEGVGRDDVDWLGRATGPAPVDTAQPGTPDPTGTTTPDPTGPVQQPLGVAPTLPSDAEPPSFTDLLRISGPGSGAGSEVHDPDAPFDWSAAEVADAQRADAQRAEVPTPADSDADSGPDAEPSLEELLGVTPPEAADDDWDDEDDDGVDDASVDPVLPPEILAAAAPSEPVDLVAPTAESSWSLSDDAARTGEVFIGDTMDPQPETDTDTSDSDADTRVTPDAPPSREDTTPEDGDAGPAASTGEVPWWAKADATPAPPTPVPPLVAPEHAVDAGPHLDPDGHLPATVGTDLDAIDQREWDGRETSDTRAIDALFGTGAMQAVDPEPGRDADAATDHRASDHGVIDDGATHHGATDGAADHRAAADPVGFGFGSARGDTPPEHDYLDDDDDDFGDGEDATGTRMLPVIGDDSGRPGGDGVRTGGAQDVRRPDGFPFPAAPVSAGPGPVDARPVVPPRSTGVYGAPAPARGTDRNDNFVNEGFGRLAAQGQRGKRLLIWGAVGLIVVLLVLVFFLTRWIIGGDPQNQPAPSPTKTSASASLQRSASPSPSASVDPEPVATASFAATAAAPGEHSWRDLAGGECVNPFTDAWATTVTVVDCAGEHPAQLTHRGTIDQADYPGADTLKAQMATTCSAAIALDLAAAANYSDIQVQGSYPADLSDWDAGDHYYYCYVSRSSGQALTGSLAPTA